MKFNNKKLEKTSIIINYTISLVLCGLLILLSDKLIDDVDKWKDKPYNEQFQNKQLLKNQQAKIEEVNVKINSKDEEKWKVNRTIKITQSNYNNAKKSFDNWLEARKSVGSPREDKEVLKRANTLDSFYKTQQDCRKEFTIINDSLNVLFNEKQQYVSVKQKEKQRAHRKRTEAIEKYYLNVFLIRLLIILPILLLGVYFIMKFRKHKYWPLFFGFVLFSFYAFFFGLVPYLPSYGGYIRYTVGIILIVLFGIYAINKIRRFVEHKKSELRISTEERSKKVQFETAEKALDDHNCPSCGKDFIVKEWDKSLEKNDKSKVFGRVTDFCRFCGLQLFKKCKSCNTENFAHLPFCCNCGDKITSDE